MLDHLEVLRLESAQAPILVVENECNVVVSDPRHKWHYGK